MKVIIFRNSQQISLHPFDCFLSPVLKTNADSLRFLVFENPYEKFWNFLKERLILQP